MKLLRSDEHYFWQYSTQGAIFSVHDFSFFFELLSVYESVCFPVLRQNRGCFVYSRNFWAILERTDWVRPLVLMRPDCELGYCRARLKIIKATPLNVKKQGFKNCLTTKLRMTKTNIQFCVTIYSTRVFVNKQLKTYQQYISSQIKVAKEICC